MEKYRAPTLQLFLAWAVLTAIGVALSFGIGILPSPGAVEAHIVDEAVAVMSALVAPVFSLIVVMLVYSVWKFRSGGKPADFGAPIEGNSMVQWAWLLISTLLILIAAGYGTVGLLNIRAHDVHAVGAAENSVLVEVIGTRFSWEYRYTKNNVTVRDELVLPLGRPAHFSVKAVDVLHSFWIPAFRTKIDAVPGLTTAVSATPNRLGSFAEDENYRVQCTELCGAGHAIMATPVRVVSEADFQAWLTRRAASGGR